MNGKKLSGELVYIMRRKQEKDIFMGNYLEKPQILLKPQVLRETTQESETVSKGTRFNYKTLEKELERDEKYYR